MKNIQDELVENLPFNNRSKNVFRCARIFTVKDLLFFNDDLPAFRNIGSKTIKHIRQTLIDIGAVENKISNN